MILSLDSAKVILPKKVATGQSVLMFDVINPQQVSPANGAVTRFEATVPEGCLLVEAARKPEGHLNVTVAHMEEQLLGITSHACQNCPLGMKDFGVSCGSCELNRGYVLTFLRQDGLQKLLGSGDELHYK